MNDAFHETLALAERLMRVFVATSSAERMDSREVVSRRDDWVYSEEE